MDNILSDLLALLASEPNQVRLFSRAEAENLAVAVREKFGNARLKSDPLWETLEECQSYYDEPDNQAKLRLKDLPGPLLLLIDDWHGYSALRISTGALLWSLLERCPYNFCWYVTDEKMSFVLCRNDHDIVIYCEQ